MAGQWHLRLALAVGMLVPAGCGAAGEAPESRHGTRGEPPVPAVRTLSGFGLGIVLPLGWEGRISRPATILATTLRAANVELPGIEQYPGPRTAEAMGPDGIVVDVNELGPYERLAFRDEWEKTGLPVVLRRSDFGRFDGFVVPAHARRNVVVDGRALQIGASFGVAEPSDGLVARANAVLATLTVDAEAARSAGEELRRECPRPLHRYPDLVTELRATRETAWLRAALRAAELSVVGYTGSALITCVRGHDVMLWATRSSEDAPPPGAEWQRADLAGLPVYVARDRAAALVQGRTVWVESGPSGATRSLPPPDALAKLYAGVRRVRLDDASGNGG